MNLWPNSSLRFCYCPTERFSQHQRHLTPIYGIIHIWCHGKNWLFQQLFHVFSIGTSQKFNSASQIADPPLKPWHHMWMTPIWKRILNNGWKSEEFAEWRGEAAGWRWFWWSEQKEEQIQGQQSHCSSYNY